MLCLSYTKCSLAMTSKHLNSVKNNQNRNRFWYALNFHFCVFKDFYHFNSVCMCVCRYLGGNQRFWIPWELVTGSCKLTLMGVGNWAQEGGEGREGEEERDQIGGCFWCWNPAETVLMSEATMKLFSKKSSGVSLLINKTLEKRRKGDSDHEG